METPKNHTKTHSNEGILTKHVLQTCRALPAHPFFFVAPDLQSVCVCVHVCLWAGGQGFCRWSTSTLVLLEQYQDVNLQYQHCLGIDSGYSDIFTAHKRQFQDNVCKPHPVALAEKNHEMSDIISKVQWFESPLSLPISCG